MPTIPLTGSPTVLDGGTSTLIAVTNSGTVPVQVQAAGPSGRIGRQILPGASATVPGWRDVRTTVQTAGQAGQVDVTLTAGTPAAGPGPGAVLFSPGAAASMSVVVTGGSWFSDEGLTAAVTWPKTVTTPTSYYPAAPGSVTAVMTVGSATQTRGVRVVDGAAETIRWESTEAADGHLSGQTAEAQTAVGAGSGTYVGLPSGGTVGQVPVIGTAGTPPVMAWGTGGGGSTALSTAYRMRRTARVASAQAAGVATQLRWTTFGSSVADVKVRELGPTLIRTFGGQQAGAIIGTWGSSAGPAGTSTSNVSTNASTGTVTDRNSDQSVWPSGLTTAFTTTGSRTYGLGGGSPTCDNIEIYYLTGAASSTDGGTFSYQVDSGSVVNVDTSVGGTGIGRVQLTPTLGAHTIKLSWVSGNSRVVGVGFWNSTISGVVPVNVAQGGINLWNCADQAFANFQTFLGWVNPDVITFEMKDSQIDAAAIAGFTAPFPFTYMAKWLDAVKNASTTNAGPDVLLIGSTPASNDATPSQQLAVNTQLATIAATYQPGLNVFAWDGYTPLGAWANVLAMDPGDTTWKGDGTHLGWKAQDFLAGLLARDIGLFQLAALPSGRDLNAATATALTQMAVGPVGAANLYVKNANPDVKLSGSRNIVFTDLTGATVVAQIAVTGGSDSILPRYSRMGGSGYPFIYGADSNNIAVGNSGSGSAPRDVILRSVVKGLLATAAVSGAVSVDLTNFTLQELTLTGNITSLAFANGSSTNGWDIELHIVQGGSGSYTLAGANASIKWAGGTAPTLSTAVGARDVLRFRKLAGPIYVEIGRTLGIA